MLGFQKLLGVVMAEMELKFCLFFVSLLKFDFFSLIQTFLGVVFEEWYHLMAGPVLDSFAPYIY